MEQNFGERKGPNSSTVVSWVAGSSPVVSVTGAHRELLKPKLWIQLSHGVYSEKAGAGSLINDASQL